MTGVASAVHAVGVSRATLFAAESTYQSAPFAARVIAEGWVSLESLTKKVPCGGRARDVAAGVRDPHRAVAGGHQVRRRAVEDVIEHHRRRPERGVDAADLEAVDEPRRLVARPGHERPRHRARRGRRRPASGRLRACSTGCSPACGSRRPASPWGFTVIPPGWAGGAVLIERVGVCGRGEREQDEAREQGEETAHPPTLLARASFPQGPFGQLIGSRRSGAAAGADHQRAVGTALDAGKAA